MPTKFKRLFKIGLPFVTLMFGIALAVNQFSRVKFKHRKATMISQKEFEAELGFKMKKPEEILEAECEKLKDVNIDTWQNIRGPRPWEEEDPLYTEQRKMLENRRKSRETQK